MRTPELSPSPAIFRVLPGHLRVARDWDDATLGIAAGGRILGVDDVLPPMGDTGASGTKLLDMLMMLSLPGKERTEAEWHALYAAAGLRVASIADPPALRREHHRRDTHVTVPARSLERGVTRGR